MQHSRDTSAEEQANISVENKNRNKTIYNKHYDE